jgi:hypothetical protein
VLIPYLPGQTSRLLRMKEVNMERCDQVD